MVNVVSMQLSIRFVVDQMPERVQDLGYRDRTGERQQADAGANDWLQTNGWATNWF